MVQGGLFTYSIRIVDKVVDYSNRSLRNLPIDYSIHANTAGVNVFFTHFEWKYRVLPLLRVTKWGVISDRHNLF